jgi:hypothetical protein
LVAKLAPREYPSVNAQHARGLDIWGKCFENSLPTRAGKFSGKRGLLKNAGYRLGHELRLLSWDEEAVLTITDDLGNAAPIDGDHRSCGSHGFDHGEAEWLLYGWVRDDVDGPVELGHIGLGQEPGQSDRVVKIERSNSTAEIVAVVALSVRRRLSGRACQYQMGRRELLANDGKRFEQCVLPFPCHKPGNTADGNGVNWQSKAAAHGHSCCIRHLGAKHVAVHGVVQSEDAVRG